MRKVLIIFTSEVGGVRTAEESEGDETESQPYSVYYSKKKEDGEVATRVTFDGKRLTVDIDGYYEGSYIYEEGFKTEGFISAGLGKERVNIFTERLVVSHKGGATLIRAKYISELMGEKSDCSFTFLIRPFSARGLADG